METNTKILLAVLGVGVVGGTIMLWPKKAGAAEMPGKQETPPKEEKLPKSDKTTWPSWWSVAPNWWTAPPPSVPTSYTPPVGWIPPWLTAETKSKEPGMISEEYKAGFNDGFTDAAYSAPFGTRQNKAKYASSSSYKNGYDQGWNEYTTSVKTGMESVERPYVRRGARVVPRNMLPSFRHRY